MGLGTFSGKVPIKGGPFSAAYVSVTANVIATLWLSLSVGRVWEAKNEKVVFIGIFPIADAKKGGKKKRGRPVSNNSAASDPPQISIGRAVVPPNMSWSNKSRGLGDC